MALLGHLGVRARMMLLIVAAMVPLVLLTGLGIWISYAEADKAARSSAAYEADLGAAQFRDVFSSARDVLSTLRVMPNLSSGDRPFCDNLLAGVVANQPSFLTIGVIDTDGTIVCHSLTHERVTFADHDLTRRIMAPDSQGFLVGSFMIGPISKKPTVAVAVRLPDNSGAVFAALDLNHFMNLAHSLYEPLQHTVALIEPSEERVLVRWPNTVAAGETFPNHPLIGLMRSSPSGGTGESIGFDGVDRFFGFAPVTSAKAGRIMLAIGAPKSAAFAGSRQLAIWATTLACFAVATALIAAFWLAFVTQLRPIKKLSHAAKKIGQGEFDVTTQMESWQAPEFLRLANTMETAARNLAAAREAEQVVASSERRFRLLADNMADMISCVDFDGTWTLISGASRELLGYEPEELIGKSFADLTIPEDRRIPDDMLKRLRDGELMRGIRYNVTKKDGAIICVEINGRPIMDGSGFVFAMRDVTERKLMEDQLAAANARLATLASTDDLTQLANRREFNRFLTREFARSLREKTRTSLLLIDVDRFKAFNDRYGHPAGDACLVRIAGAIDANLRRPGDLGARYGGEELAAVLPNTSLEGAYQRAEAIRQAVRDLDIEHLGSEKGRVTISIGVATSYRGMAAAADLLRKADEALYAAKASGRDRVQIAADLGLAPASVKN